MVPALAWFPSPPSRPLAPSDMADSPSLRLSSWKAGVLELTVTFCCFPFTAELALSPLSAIPWQTGCPAARQPPAALSSLLSLSTSLQQQFWT